MKTILALCAALTVVTGCTLVASRGPSCASAAASYQGAAACANAALPWPLRSR